MPYSIEHIEDEGGLLVSWTGMVRGDEIIRSYRESFTPLKRLVRLRYIITDYTDADGFDMTPDDILTISEIANAAAEHNDRIYGLAIMTTDLQYGMARMWQSYVDDDKTGWHTFVTRTREEGLEWLRRHLDVGLIYKHGSGWST